MNKLDNELRACSLTYGPAKDVADFLNHHNFYDDSQKIEALHSALIGALKRIDDLEKTVTMLRGRVQFK
jgi:hypothetical protein